MEKINGAFETWGGRTWYVIQGRGIYRRIPIQVRVL
jgi:hypothetical protein